ncbi:MAG: Two component transcriptional regulator, winged helix family [Thermotogales bacterium 46_20]|nr:MAG: Two component transcriptional regulator, winged helix family [Thermotogales bacterium 46_20]
MMMTRILLIEDDVHISRLLKMELEHEGYSVEELSSGSSALDQFEEVNPHLVILDVMLPELDGFSVLEGLKEISPQTPVIMLTARTDLKDRVRGLKSGADDYITKPFEIEELLARIEAILRRMGHTEVIAFEEIELLVNSRTVKVAEELIDLSKTEFELLRILLINAGIVMSKERLLKEVWGDEDWGNPNVVEVYVNYLRRKLKGAARHLKTVRGVGYVVR